MIDNNSWRKWSSFVRGRKITLWRWTSNLIK
jgi:hypothetical protein